METGKTIPQLEYEVQSLGLTVTPTGKNGKIMKRDYVQSLMIYNLIQLYGSLESVPVNVKFRLSFDSPQLAYNYFDLKPKEQDFIWDSPLVWLTEKINGVRGTLIFSKKMGYSLFSRDINDTNYLWTDYAPKVFDSNIPGLEENGVFDVEIQLGNQNVKERLKGLGYEVVSDFQVISALFMLAPDTYEQIRGEYPNLFKFKLIDIYFWSGDARKFPYSDREQRFDGAIQVLKNVGINIDRPQYCKDPIHKKAFHEGIMKAGGEGTIAVFTDKPCNLSGSRKRDEMVKIKRPIFPLLFEPDALTDTVDGWVSKIRRKTEEGMVHTIEVSAFNNVGEVKLIAVTEAIPLSIRTSGVIDEGAVVELSGSKWENGLIQDAVVERVRFDKMSHECVLGV